MSDDHRHPLFARLQAKLAANANRKGAIEHRRRMLAGLSGRVVEVGPGSGVNFPYYPAAVTEVLAVEPEPHMRKLATEAARAAPVPVRIVDGTAERLPAPDGSMDAGVVAGLLCSVRDPAAALAELARVIRPGGELRFNEHVRSDGPLLGRAQDFADHLWPRLFGGCHPNRNTEAEIERAGFAIGTIERLDFRPTPPVDVFVAPRILGSARRA
jgi:ubiquinone/menaquinone biosynthesis C-methylase UbiE